MKPLTDKEKFDVNKELAYKLQENLFEEFWGILKRDKEFNELPRKEYTKRIFLIAINMTLDLMSDVSPEDIDEEEFIGG